MPCVRDALGHQRSSGKDHWHLGSMPGTQPSVSHGKVLPAAPSFPPRRPCQWHPLCPASHGLPTVIALGSKTLGGFLFHTQQTLCQGETAGGTGLHSLEYRLRAELYPEIHQVCYNPGSLLRHPPGLSVRLLSAHLSLFFLSCLLA